MGVFMGYVIRSSDTTAINGIRQLVSVNLTPGVLSDAVIDGPTFVRAAEFHVYKLLGFISDDTSNVDADAAYAQRIGLDDPARAYAFPSTFSYKGQWEDDTDYILNDIVRYGSSLTPPNEKLYYANKANRVDSTPGPPRIPGTFDYDDWTEITNIDFKEQYTNGTLYTRYDIVYNGTGSNERLYFANKNIRNPTAFDHNDWIRIVSGVRILVGQTAAQRQSEERIKIAVEYQAAIRLILSMPQLLEEQILRERVRFQEINWEKRIEFYESETTDTLEPEVPDGTIFSDATAIFGEVKQFVAF